MNEAITYPRLLRRVQAVLIDSLFITSGIYSSILFISFFDTSNSFIKAFFFIFPIFALEPLLVAYTGGTLGQHILKIRVRSLNSPKNINIFIAIIRFIIKFILGWFSLLFVLNTKKHQAIHDLVTQSIVINKNSNELPAHEALSERVIENPDYIYPSKLMRVIAIIGYIFALFVILIFTVEYFFTPGCLVNSRLCTSSDRLIANIVVYISLILTGLFIVLGWKGMLYGCRRKFANENA